MYKEYTMRNGLKTIVSPMSNMESVSIGLWIGTGGRYEAEKESGISHLVEHMLFKGTYKRTAKDLKEAIEGIGGLFNGFTADEVTCYMVKVPRLYWKLGVDILSDMVFNAKFEESELKKEKHVVCEEIKMYRDQPSEYVVEVLADLMWPNNALGRPLTGTTNTVKSFTRKHIVNYVDKHYYPSNMALTAVGNVNAEKVKAYVETVVKGGRKSKSAVKKPALSQKECKAKFIVKKINQAHVALGFRAESENSRERFAIKILNTILGGNMSSRLFEELREKYGLCYDIASNYKRHSDTGEFVIHAGVDNKKCEKSVSSIIDELRNIKDMGVTENELVRAKEYAKGQFLLSLEGTSSRMMWFGYRFMLEGRIPEVKSLLRGIDNVTIEDIRSVSNKIFKSKALNLAIVGDIDSASKKGIEKQIRAL